MKGCVSVSACRNVRLAYMLTLFPSHVLGTDCISNVGGEDPLDILLAPLVPTPVCYQRASSNPMYGWNKDALTSQQGYGSWSDLSVDEADSHEL